MRQVRQAYLVQEFVCSGLEQIDRVNILIEIHVYSALTIIAKKDLDIDIFVQKVFLREWIWPRRQSQGNSYWSIFLMCILNVTLVPLSVLTITY